jgi:hypothetical protein
MCRFLLASNPLEITFGSIDGDPFAWVPGEAWVAKDGGPWVRVNSGEVANNGRVLSKAAFAAKFPSRRTSRLPPAPPIRKDALMTPTKSTPTDLPASISSEPAPNSPNISSPKASPSDPDEVTTHHHNQALERLLAERVADLSPTHSEMDAMSSKHLADAAREALELRKQRQQNNSPKK